MGDTVTWQKIRNELYRTLVLMGADAGLLGTVGSWGTSLPDQDVFANLRGWNEAFLKEVKGRIEHYEMTSPHPVYSQDEAQQNLKEAP